MMLSSGVYALWREVSTPQGGREIVTLGEVAVGGNVDGSPLIRRVPRHLLPQGEKGAAEVLLPLWEKVDRERSSRDG